ncbi:hypothetical protein KIW84_054815 [Lathyrus oleraceus]|uniref:DUF4371 domain-containing protein n=1 Tax=Pisum sativum TaxID=3888 RepID=A0A9D5AIZ8_PEA|nr:hypothetical protein KIW84_054815 [Pisum sativum]
MSLSISDVPSVINELLTKESRFKTHSNMIHDKGILYTPPFVFAAPVSKEKYQANKKNFKSSPSNVDTAAHTTIGFCSDYVCLSKTTSQIYDITEKIQKIFLSHVPCLPPLLKVQILLVYQLCFDSHITRSSKLTHIDPFGLDGNVYSDCNVEKCMCNTTTNLDIDIPLVPTVTQQPPMTVDPLSHPSRLPSYDSQGLAFRGNDESISSRNKGNFLELMNFLVNHNEDIYKVWKNCRGNLKLTSPDIQKDIVKAAATVTTQVILDDLGDDLFVILINESRDISVKEQMVVVIRYVNNEEKLLSVFLVLFMFQLLVL